GTTILGSEGAPDGDARLFLSSPISGGMLLANQEACGVKSGDTPFPPALVPPEGLPAPVVEGPLRDCERRIRVSGVLVGALVIVERSGGPKRSSLFDYPDLEFDNIFPPLKLGEVVTARQEFPACGRRSPNSAAVTVGSHTPVPVPNLRGPICAPALAVHLSNL